MHLRQSALSQDGAICTPDVSVIMVTWHYFDVDEDIYELNCWNHNVIGPPTDTWIPSAGMGLITDDIQAPLAVTRNGLIAALWNNETRSCHNIHPVDCSGNIITTDQYKPASYFAGL